MKTSYLKFKVWIEATDENGEKIEIVISEIMSSERLSSLIDSLGFKANIYKKTPSNFPLSQKEIEYFELYHGIRFGEFNYNQVFFFQRA